MFFCQNNQWAISEPLERQSRIPLYRRAEGFGFPGIRVDGNDVFACLAVTRKALEDARSGQGPTLIEAFTYRMGAHTTTDDPTRYRLQAELEAWKLKDPIERVKAYLVKSQMADKDFFDGDRGRGQDGSAAELRKRPVWNCPTPQPMAIFENVYGEHHALMAEEQEQFARTSGPSRR